MKDQFVPYELALKLKELGFNEMCIATFDEDNNFELQDFQQSYDTFPKHIISAPLWQQAFDWFREKYAYFPSFDYQHGENNGFFYCIINIEDEEFYFPEDFEFNVYKTYEEVRQACLEKLIEICKKN